MELNETMLPKPSFCSECGIDRGYNHKQIRILREKLECSELQNLNLLAECKQLRKDLREARFRERSSISASLCPPLPNEVLQEIFSFATYLKGDLVSPHWRVEEPYKPWVISSQTRRSISLVCRQWHTVGLEYLYEHIVIFEQSQFYKLINNEGNFSAHWIRGLEFIMLRDQMNKSIETSPKICRFINQLPPGRLRIFGLEDGQCGQPRYNLNRVLELGLILFHGSLESLHLPCFRVEGVHLSLPNSLAPGGDTLDNVKEFPKLRTLSLANGRWETCTGGQRVEHPMVSLLSQYPHGIQTLHVNWFRRKDVSKHLRLLNLSIHLQEMHIHFGLNSMLTADLDDFLELVPQLRRLVLTPSDRGSFLSIPEVLTHDNVFHQSLVEIILAIEFPSTYRVILLIDPIFSKIRSGHLLGLKRVILRGQFPAGCLDGNQVFPRRYEECWGNAIEACAWQGVEFVNNEGVSIHLWGNQHGIKLDSDDGGTETDSFTSDEGEWWEVSTSGYYGSSTEDVELVSDDSEDSPYRYSSRPDLDYYSDSGSSSNESDLDAP